MEKYSIERRIRSLRDKYINRRKQTGALEYVLVPSDKATSNEI